MCTMLSVALIRRHTNHCARSDRQTIMMAGVKNKVSGRGYGALRYSANFKQDIKDGIKLVHASVSTVTVNNKHCDVQVLAKLHW